MAHKRKEEKVSSVPQRATVKRQRQAPAGRIARLREPGEPRVLLAQDPHSIQVRAEIDAALSEALRMREDITRRIERGLHEVGSGSAPPAPAVERPFFWRAGSPEHVRTR
jgi:hypothetical protein